MKELQSILTSQSSVKESEKNELLMKLQKELSDMEKLSKSN